ncbi:MAG: DUF3551 domain-containing protein [Bradyrhizobium sp.]
MRFIIWLTALTAIALSAAPASAQDFPYCLQGTQWGYPGNCQFATYQQCLATASGTDAGCGLNPRTAYGVRPERRRSYNGW